MTEINFLIWLFPILFIIHDFEEILPFCIYILQILLKSGFFNIHTVIAASVISAIVIIVNGVAIHMGMEVFDKWLINYQKKQGR